MATLQVRSIDDNLYRALGRRARIENRSISQEVVSILKAHLSLPGRQYADTTSLFLEMCGSWSDNRSAEKIVEQIRQARQSGGRFQDIF